MKVLVVGRTGVAGQATVADRACWGVLVIGMKTDVTYHQLCIQQPTEEACRAIIWVLSGRCTQKTCGSKPELFQINVRRPIVRLRLSWMEVFKSWSNLVHPMPLVALR